MTNFSHYRYYEILDIQPGASKDEIKVAYRDLCKVWHPDRFEGDERLQKKAEEKFKEINEAYQILSNPSNHKSDPPPRREYSQPEPEPETETRSYSDTWRSRTSSSNSQTWTNQEKDTIPPMSMLQKVFIGAAIVLILFGVAIEMNWIPTKSGEASSPNIIHTLGQNPSQEAHAEAQPTVQAMPTPMESLAVYPNPTQPAAEMKNVITLGTNSKQVMDIQGVPNKFSKSPLLEFEVWNYGNSTITISLEKQTVIEWNNLDKNLKVKVFPAGPPSQATSLTVGSPRDDVIYLQGTPDKIVRSPALGYEVWYYGLSKVKLSLKKNTVLALSDQSGNLKMKPEEVGSL